MRVLGALGSLLCAHFTPQPHPSEGPASQLTHVPSEQPAGSTCRCLNTRVPMPAPPTAYLWLTPGSPTIPPSRIIHFPLVHSRRLRMLSPFSPLETVLEQPQNLPPRLLPAATALLFPIRAQALQGAASIFSMSHPPNLSNLLPVGSAQLSLQQNHSGHTTVLDLRLVWPTDRLSPLPPRSLAPSPSLQVSSYLTPWAPAVPCQPPSSENCSVPQL